MTVLELISASLRLINALASSETPDANVAVDARTSLNCLLGEWMNDGLISLTEQQIFNTVINTSSYTIGTGMTWVGHKPLKVLSAILSDGSNDYPLEIIGENDYLNIGDKSTVGQPKFLFYKPSNSTGTVYLDCKPDKVYAITLVSQAAFVEYSANATVIDLPTGYLNALKYNLALELAPEYEIEPSQFVMKRAQETLAAIKRTNLKKPSKMQFDPILTGKYNYERPLTT